MWALFDPQTVTRKLMKFDWSARKWIWGRSVP